MNKPFNKQRFWIVVSLLCLSIFIFKTRPLWMERPAPELSSIYCYYAPVEGIEASFVCNFPINDTVFVDVTLLRATTDSSWALLKKDFHISPPPEHAQMEIDQGRDIVTVRYCSREDPRKPMNHDSISQNNILAISNLNHAVSIFHTQNTTEQRDVSFYNWNFNSL